MISKYILKPHSTYAYIYYFQFQCRLLDSLKLSWELRYKIFQLFTRCDKFLFLRLRGITKKLPLLNTKGKNTKHKMGCNFFFNEWVTSHLIKTWRDILQTFWCNLQDSNPRLTAPEIALSKTRKIIAILKRNRCLIKLFLTTPSCCVELV